MMVVIFNPVAGLRRARQLSEIHAGQSSEMVGGGGRLLSVGTIIVQSLVPRPEYA
jgi:hypothetical protein